MPVDLPSYALTEDGVVPDLGMTWGQTEGGVIITSRRYDPFWRGTLVTRPLEVYDTVNEYAQMLAFLSRVVDQNLSVDILHPRHLAPRSYTTVTWPGGSQTLAATPTDLRQITVNGLVLHAKLLEGDRLTVRHGALRVHRWISEDVSDAATTNQVVKVTPRLPVGVVASGDTVDFLNPVMRVHVDPGSWDPNEAAEQSSLSFDVTESLA